jgi:hypothetical protein
MPATHRYDRDILALNDTELEQFVRAWVEKKAGYHQVTSFTGPGDKGRDVVGFVTPQLHEGAWHNYQCKQYGKSLPTRVGLSEIGKVLYYAYKGDYTPPEKFLFVVPRGLNRNLKGLVNKPSSFKAALLDGWDECCGKSIIENAEILLTPALRSFIEGYDFERIKALSLDEILLDSAAKPVLFDWFGADPGPPPAGVVPAEVLALELPYIAQLVDAYAERDRCEYASHDDIRQQADHWPHLCVQRERYFDAAAFNRFYRDNTNPAETEAFQSEVFHGIADVHQGEHADSLARVQAVMMQAATVQASGVLGRYARIQVKQGTCHHFINDGKIKWKR